MRILAFLLLMFFALPSFSSDELDRFLEDARPQDFQFLNDIYDSTYEHRRPEITPIPETSELRNPHEDIPPFRAVLRAGAELQKLSDQSFVKTNRSIYVQAKLHQEGSPFTYLLNTKGEQVYLTRTVNLSSLQEVTTLYPTTDPTEIYSNKTPFRSVDKIWLLETKISLHLESTDAFYLSTFHRVEESSASSQKLQVESFFDGDFPVDVGLSLSFQTGTLGESIDPDRVSFNGVYFGPVIKRQLGKTEKSSFDIFLKAEKSLGLSSEDQFFQNSFSSNVYSLGADWTYETFIGKFFIGALYRQQQLSLKDTTDPALRIPSSKESLSGFGVFAGYRFTVTL